MIEETTLMAGTSAKAASSVAQYDPADLWMMRRLRLRYAGTCVRCGATLPRGVEALYHAASKAVRCTRCPDETYQADKPPSRPTGRLEDQSTTWPAMPAEPAPLDLGTAGASARHEYNRLVEKREARVKKRFGRQIGGLVFAVTNEPQSTRAWATGAIGEEKLSKSLARLADVITLHDRQVFGTLGNIDHIVIGPAGVFVVDTKHYKGKLRVHDRGGLFRTDNHLYVGGRDCSQLADNMG
jgi:hypothetical protein